MEYITERLWLDTEIPFALYRGTGFSCQDVENGKVYMHNHHSLEINFCLSGEGEYTIINETYPILKNDIFIINNLFDLTNGSFKNLINTSLLECDCL